MGLEKLHYTKVHKNDRIRRRKSKSGNHREREKEREISLQIPFDQMKIYQTYVMET